MIVVCDFDTTLKFPFTKMANEETVELLKNHQSNGDDIFIVTSRHFSESSESEIRDFLQEHNIEVVNVFHTDGKLKTFEFRISEIDVFIDDDEVERNAMAKAFPNCVIVNPVQQFSDTFLNWVCFGE